MFALLMRCNAVQGNLPQRARSATVLWIGLMSVRHLRVCNALSELWAYRDALYTQERLAALCQLSAIPDTLLLLQHPPTYTVGKRGTSADFKVGQEQLLGDGAEVHKIKRGGETTFHGPGQLVIYPVINLRRLGLGARAYVEGLEDTVIATLGAFGIDARGRVPGRTGVWTGERKIAALGVQISQGVTRHGAAVNVTTDLSCFSHIIPCGIEDKEVTSVARELGDQSTSVQDVGARFCEAFARQYGYAAVETVSRRDIEAQIAAKGPSVAWVGTDTAL